MTLAKWFRSSLATAAIALQVLPAHSASDYAELVSLFNELRTFQAAPMANGIPDYTPSSMKKHYLGLQMFQKRLKAIDSKNWPVWQQVDYHLVRAEMNGMEFFHKVHKPWARDPGFYSMWSGDAGATMNASGYFAPLRALREAAESTTEGGAANVTLSSAQQAELYQMLRGVPEIYRQARQNLAAPVADFAEFAVRNLAREQRLYADTAESLSMAYPALTASAREAATAVADYRGWLQENMAAMTAPAGLGKKHYDWWMRNVQLSPWGWKQSYDIIQREYDRVITFLKLEENRNRELPPQPVAMTAAAWNNNLREALHYVVSFLDSEAIMTIEPWVNPEDYYAEGWKPEPSSADGSPEAAFQPGNTSIDTKVRQREILPGEAHEYIGHMLDDQRQERLQQSEIRSKGRRFNMDSMRREGWAVALEELLMQAGVLDERPRQGREMQYLMNASHMSLAIPDMLMQVNEINLAEARRLCAEIMPRGWSQEDERMVWFEMQSNQRNPGGFHSNVVTGKAYFMKMFREAAQDQGSAFQIRQFVDSFLSSGTIPMSLVRWEMSGNSDDITLVTEPL